MPGPIEEKSRGTSWKDVLVIMTALSTLVIVVYIMANIPRGDDKKCPEWSPIVNGDRILDEIEVKETWSGFDFRQVNEETVYKNQKMKITWAERRVHKHPGWFGGDKSYQWVEMVPMEPTKKYE